MPRILLLASTDLNHDQRMIRICGTLAKGGYEVLLLGRQLPESTPLPRRPYSQHRLKCFFRRGKGFYLEFNLRLLFFLLRSSFDAVCAVDLDTLAPAFLASRIRRKALIYDAHEFYSELPELEGRPFTRGIWEALAKCLIPRTDLAYTVGPALAEQLRQRYGKAFQVIRNTPYARDAPRIMPADPILLYQGALNKGRGLEKAIEAMQYLPEATLWLAGEGDLSLRLREQVKDLNLQDRIRFLGNLSPEKLAEITPQARVGLNLLESESLSYYYSLANKAFDYVQAWIPSLQMDFPEYRQLNARFHCFELLPPDLDVQTLVSVLQRLLRDESRYLSLRRQCREASKEWVWEKEEEKLLELYRGLPGFTP